MSIREGLLAEFDREMTVARTSLARIPEGTLDWRPHAKSMTMGQLATHLARLPRWTAMTFATDSIDLTPPAAPQSLETVPAILAEFDQHVAEARAALEQANEDAFLVPWTLKVNGHTVFTMPRIAVLRVMVMNHLIHHRAQLGVYLRLNDVALPSIYGPTADEGGM